MSLVIGYLAGWILEFSYRSYESKKFIKPLFIDCQMYALIGAFLYVLYFWDIFMIYKIILIIFFTTYIEFLTGYLALKFKKVRLWDYSEEFMNYEGLICPRFSFYWLVISLLCYYFLIPLISLL